MAKTLEQAAREALEAMHAARVKMPHTTESERLDYAESDLRAALAAEQQQPTHEELVEVLRGIVRDGYTMGADSRARALIALHDAGKAVRS